MDGRTDGKFSRYYEVGWGVVGLGLESASRSRLVGPIFDPVLRTEDFGTDWWSLP